MHRKHYGLKIIVILGITMILENSCLTFSSPDPELSCLFMQSCILPCSFKNGGDFAISWFYTEGNLNVHFYHNQDQLGYQNQRFRNRTSVFKDQIPRNNFSLKLTGVKIQDEGRYQCLRSSTTGFKELFIDLKVDAPVSDIRIHQDGNRITCSSEGIYPQPELTWSTEPPSNTTLNETTRIQKTEDQLYNISSSLTGPDGPDLIYSCSIRTRRNQRRATFRELSETSAPYRTTTLHCSDSNSSAASLVWRFNDQIILSQTEPRGMICTVEQWVEMLPPSRKVLGSPGHRWVFPGHSSFLPLPRNMRCVCVCVCVYVCACVCVVALYCDELLT
uniref:Ig-like domain-containing protein n=1 Tax=Poecilia mexicana TaxID=48701 RepID=A0A3B3YMI2_9TELE